MDYIHHGLKQATQSAGPLMRARVSGAIYIFFCGVVAGAFLVLAFYHGTGGL